jgi:hypothetical protein
LPLFSAIAGAVFGVFALYLLKTQRFVKGEGDGNIEVEIPLFGRIKSNYPAIVVVFIGAFLIFYPQYRQTPAPVGPCPPAPPTPVSQVTVKGTLHRSDQESLAGIQVGVIPGTITFTDSDGAFSLSVNQVPGSYYVVATVPDSPYEPVWKSLSFTGDTAVFNYVFATPRSGPHLAAGTGP